MKGDKNLGGDPISRSQGDEPLMPNRMQPMVLRPAAWFLIAWLLAACAPQSRTQLTALQKTGMAAVAMKATDQFFTTQTAAAAPSSTPTSTSVPANTPLCSPQALAASVQKEGATGSITFNLILKNESNQGCALQGPPRVQMVNMAGQALAVESYLNCFECNTPGNDFLTPVPATQTAMIHTATEQAEHILNRRIFLQPGEQASIFMIWTNWCKDLPNGGVSLRLRLPGQLGEITAPTAAKTGGRCGDPQVPSQLMVSQYTKD
jgi:hypothetical protein